MPALPQNPDCAGGPRRDAIFAAPAQLLAGAAAMADPNAISAARPFCPDTHHPFVQVVVRLPVLHCRKSERDPP